LSHVSLGSDLLSESLALLKEILDNIGGEVSLRSFDPSLDKFISDEEATRGEELAEEATLTLSRVLLPKRFKLPDPEVI